jgi:ATP-dependent Clp protease ATP-binding subunit ClpC
MQDQLQEKIARNPYSVVLFDEIEKAHPDVLNILLQIMDDGVLVDAKGKSFDFTHSIVILTSNLGTELINKESVGFSINTNVSGSLQSKNLQIPVTGKRSALVHDEGISVEDKEKIQKVLLENLKQILKPELLNRFDDIIVFNKLGKTDTSKIFDVLLSQVKENFNEKGISLKVSKSAKEFVVKEGFSEEYGARSLRRAIEKHIVDGAIGKLLENEDKEVSLIKIDYKTSLTFEIE